MNAARWAGSRFSLPWADEWEPLACDFGFGVEAEWWPGDEWPPEWVARVECDREGRW